jgi:hypothetical protein
MGPFEIFNAVRTWKNCPDMRPWLIVDVRANGVFGCFPISGECYEGGCFVIGSNHPDFPATGLTKTSYVDDQKIVELGIGEFKKRRGQLVNELLREFRAFAGDF